MPYSSVLLKGESWVIKEIVEDYWHRVLAIRLCCNCLPLLLPEQAHSLTVLSAYTAPEHPPNFPLPLVLYTIGVEELFCPNLPRTPLSSVIPRLYPALIAPADLIPLLIRPVLVLLRPRKPKYLICL
jgi:hypothetical protein